MTDAEADLAYLNDALSGKPSLDEAIAELDGLCREFVALGRELRNAEIGSASRERLISACFDARQRVHDAQRRWMLKGIDVYIAHDRNGSPIRVDKVARNSVIGF